MKITETNDTRPYTDLGLISKRHYLVEICHGFIVLNQFLCEQGAPSLPQCYKFWCEILA